MNARQALDHMLKAASTDEIYAGLPVWGTAAEDCDNLRKRYPWKVVREASRGR
jgi:hypothetical protein